jgi:hypothetical protein
VESRKLKSLRIHRIYESSEFYEYQIAYILINSFANYGKLDRIWCCAKKSSLVLLGE